MVETKPEKKKEKLPTCKICMAEMDKKHIKLGLNICVYCDNRHGPFNRKWMQVK
jgi:hypothetical protein